MLPLPLLPRVLRVFRHRCTHLLYTAAAAVPVHCVVDDAASTGTLRGGWRGERSGGGVRSRAREPTPAPLPCRLEMAEPGHWGALTPTLRPPFVFPLVLLLLRRNARSERGSALRVELTPSAGPGIGAPNDVDRRPRAVKRVFKLKWRLKFRKRFLLVTDRPMTGRTFHDGVFGVRAARDLAYKVMR